MKKAVFILSALLAFACTEPLSTEQFVLGGGPYVFTVDMTDSTLKGALLRAEWRSPSDSVFIEKVYLPLDGTRRSYYSRQVYVPYRAEMAPLQPGLWTLTFRQEDRMQRVPLRGLGLVVRKNR